MAYARSATDKYGVQRFQALEDHLLGVAKRAADFAAEFHAAEWGESAGRWHDLGKYAPDFQAYLLQSSGVAADDGERSVADAGRVDHSGAGAMLSLDRLGALATPLAHCIAAHHHGLYDHNDYEDRMRRVADAGRLAAALAGSPPETILSHAALPLPDIPGIKAGEPLAFATWLRLLFSCLVDADVLDSEAFADPAASRERGAYPTLSELKPRLDAHLARFVADTPVRRLRAGVLADCRAGATGDPGLFTLSVPTGGGKTLSSLAFAVEHALRNGLRRVIYVIPYTSIIEQTADVLRGVFGDAVVEHHSNFESERETQRSRLASENWDAPIIVTTSVQFFESLFAARSSRCRKLHNILSSVVVLDEAQMLPPPFLQPIVDLLRLLVVHYRTTVLLCTATQPALAEQRGFGSHFRGLPAATELVAERDVLYQQLARVEVELPDHFSRSSDWPALAKRIVEHDCVLVIVNSRADAETLHALLPPGTVHLSGRMCGAHRSEVIRQVRERLCRRREEGDPTPLRVVSTSLIEAGVDVDFPVVFRALAGLDSIAQAAGRCNREGLLEGLGRVVVFVPPSAPPAGLQRLAAQACVSVLSRNVEDPLRPEAFTRYFARLYGDCQLDQHDIIGLLKPRELRLRTAAERFRLIDDSQLPVLVPYRLAADDRRYADARDALLARQGQGSALRKLQRYTVTLGRNDHQRLQQRGELRELFPGVWELVAESQYHAATGLRINGPDGSALLMV